MKSALLRGVGILAVAAMGLSACSSSGSSSSGASGEGNSGIPKPAVSCDVPAQNIDASKLDLTKLSGEITFQTQGLKGTFDDYINGKIKEFEEANPGTTIKWTDQAGSADFDSLMVTQAANCSMPDVVNVPGSTIMALSSSNLLLDFDVKAPGIGDKFVPAIWDSVKFAAQEHHNALPWYFGPYLTTYNKDVFKKAGLDPNTPPTTMTDYFADAQKIADSGSGDYALYGNTSWYMVPQWRASGVKMMNDDYTKFTFAQDKNALEWVTQMADLYKKGAIPPDSITGDLDQSKAYGAGNLGYGTPNASFLRNVQTNSGSVYAVTGVGEETRNEGITPVFDGQYLGVSVTTKNAPLAVAWSEFITNEKSGLEWAQYGIDTGKAVVFPATTKALQDPLLAEVSGDDVFSQARKIAAKEALEAEAYVPLFYVTGQVSDALINNINKAIVGQVSPQEGLDNAQTEMNSLLTKLQRNR
ncbi:extracellular solute-binding protein [Neoactinobaculum massilliense]|uniref:extracellular solute-binding protein n=1 Tax=Neoactinobaculum massilliense TaxID=2364794 RepID=UPI000F548D56|nr:extracellular solute-binding protein [Neoactinobaculum massilliense]